MDGFLHRDMRHLAGTKRTSDAPSPAGSGLAIHHRWDDGVPGLVVRDASGRLVRLDLSGRVDLAVFEAAWCVGRVVQGRSVPCPYGRPADHFGRCVDCHPLPVRECVFEPSCQTCTLPFCRGAHRVYVAWYGARPKIGMTRSVRGSARLVDQGADAYAFLADVVDRFEARRVEDRLSRALGVPQARRPLEVLSQMARPVPWDAIEAAHEALMQRATAIPAIAPGPLLRAGPWPGAWPLPEVPVPVGVVGRHVGDILGVKGRWLVYREGSGPLWGLRMSEVETHEVRYDPTRARPVAGPTGGPEDVDG